MAGDGIEEGLESASSPLLPGEKSTSSSATRNQHSITPVLVCSTLVALCGSFTYGCSVGYSSPAESGIMEDLGLSVSAVSANYVNLFSSLFFLAMTIGGMVGAILSGKMADLVGRRGTMWACQIICMAGWLAIAFAKKAWCLDIGRFLVGVAIGILTYVVPVYISEITPKNLRGRFTSANQLLVCCGFAVTYFVGSIVSWRALSLMATIPSILQIVCLFFVPESPRWLAKLGRQKEFEASLQRLRGAESDISEEAVDIREAIEILKQTSAETRTLELFQRRYAYVIIVGEGLILLQTFGGNSAVSYYLGTIFAKANVSTSSGPIIFALLQIPTSIATVLLMDSFGRRTLLMVSATTSCLCLFLVGLSFCFLESHNLKELTPILTLVGILGFGIGFTIGMSGIPWVIMAEIFPVNVKASAGSLVVLTSWASSWVVTYTFSFMLEWSSAGTFFIFSGMCALTILFVWKMSHGVLHEIPILNFKAAVQFEEVKELPFSKSTAKRKSIQLYIEQKTEDHRKGLTELDIPDEDLSRRLPGCSEQATFGNSGRRTSYPKKQGKSPCSENRSERKTRKF
ncbi:SUGAR TRANSPORTER ERD6-LIKE 1-RELATED [Salix koriyanagi]|uniref:SUGAR TRANSPORTER ERD6-LIKE 1-RELATED n=1 Tax=Salix koriyanagi TaxID=2511006 RepID=A0A9Q0SMX9_9ROSI|nr:SUGAR TRANSPORTER ERD6-LIKE 1-RELATED [Salix koriyanagi]